MSELGKKLSRKQRLLLLAMTLAGVFGFGLGSVRAFPTLCMLDCDNPTLDCSCRAGDGLTCPCLTKAWRSFRTIQPFGNERHFFYMKWRSPTAANV